MKWWKRFTVIGGVVVAAAWLCTGGLVVHRFWFNSSQSFDRAFQPFILVNAKGREVVYGVPYVFQHFSSEAPLSLQLTYITHRSMDHPEIVFDRCIVHLADGTEIDLTDRVRVVVPQSTEHWYIDDFHTMQKVPSLRSEITLPDCVPNEKPFKLRLEGRLRSSGETVERFDAVFSFTPNYESEVLTNWWWILSAGC